MKKYIEYLIINNSGLFDAAFYYSNYPDVRQADMDPLWHYIKWGWKEGRDPSIDFSTFSYLEENQDVKEMGINPLLHFIRHGKIEGRNTNNITERYKSDKNLFDPTPLVSIIIAIYNALTLTQACIEALYKTIEDLSFEVIVIDNASEDGSFEWLSEKEKTLPNLSISRMQTNIGFGPAVNIGLQMAKGKYLVILNNDTIPAPKWLENLVAALETDVSIGIVSPVTNYVGEGPQIDVKAQELPPVPNLVAQYAETITQNTEIYYEPNRLVFFCVLLRRELVDLIGYLDEGYQKGNFEDDDYCMRARMVGYRLAIARNAFVYHHGTATFKLNKISHSDWMEKNRIRFYQKAGRIAVSIRPEAKISFAPQLSIILRTKDRPQLLRRALTSLTNQTSKNFEVIVVNDGGVDVSNIIEFYKSFYSLNYIHYKESKGRTAAINTGLQEAKLKWVAYLDDDDILYPWHYEVLLNAAKKDQTGLVYSDYNRVLFLNTEDAIPKLISGTPSWEFNRDQLMVQNYLPIHTYIHRRDLIDRIGFWNEDLDRLEDYDFLLRLSSITDFNHVRKVTCEYRFYLDSMNTVFNGRKEYLTALQQIYPRYLVTNHKILNTRQQIIKALQLQVEEIDTLLQTDDKDQLRIRREILRITNGF
jgi:GT2 family glycosyltransferase